MFKLESFMGKRILASSLINADDVWAFFTTRDLPLKVGEREDLAKEIENNKKLLCKGLNIPLKNLVIPQQTHSDNIALINHAVTLDLTFPNTDAVITNQPEIALVLNFADCVPVILYDEMKKVIATIHAGWRGTAAQITSKTVAKMIENFSCNPNNIIALIGPAIGKCCFEAKKDVLEQLNNSFDSKHSEVFSNNHADLKLINKFQLLDMGIEKIELSEYCTSCQNELFFSYRKENGYTARHSAVIMLKNTMEEK